MIAKTRRSKSKKSSAPVQNTTAIIDKMRISLILNDENPDRASTPMPLNNGTSDVPNRGSNAWVPPRPISNTTEAAPSSPCLSTTSLTSNSSSASLKSTPRKPRNPPRQGYTDEQAHFIWWHRDDQSLSWAKVEKAFVRYYGQKRMTGGLQCKYYRVLDHYGVLKVRSQRRWVYREGRKDPAQSFGMAATTKLHYGWMDARHLD